MRYSGNSSIQVVSSLKNSKIRLMINIVLQILNRLKCQKKICAYTEKDRRRTREEIFGTIRITLELCSGSFNGKP